MPITTWGGPWKAATVNGRTVVAGGADDLQSISINVDTNANLTAKFTSIDGSVRHDLKATILDAVSGQSAKGTITRATGAGGQLCSTTWNVILTFSPDLANPGQAKNMALAITDGDGSCGFPKTFTEIRTFNR